MKNVSPQPLAFQREAFHILHILLSRRAVVVGAYQPVVELHSYENLPSIKPFTSE